MAPLLGRKPYPLAKPLSEPPGPGEEIYIIEHTKEAFKNKDEYEARLRRYAERIWTCKSTGSKQLTHKEAWEEEQEVTELLQEEYPVWFEKPVLEIVHHNTVSLDKLVDQSWLEILTKYAVGEECDLMVGNDKTLRVKVVKIHPLESPPEESLEKKMEGACDSPSSDKENASQENLKKDPPSKEEESRRNSLSDRARRSPRKLPTTAKEEKKKWVMPKFLPHKYDVKLVSEDKVVSDVPADSLYRTERPPNKEIMRYFVRHYAIRLGAGESAPWVVEDELVKKFNLPSKFSDFLLSPHKFLAENPAPKRKSLSSPEGKPSKRLKTGETGTAGDKGEKKKVKKDSQNMPLSPTLWAHVKVRVKKLNGSPLKMKNSGKSDGQNILGSPKSNKKSSDSKRSRKSGQKGSGSTKKDKMKQMTLLDLAKSPKVGSPKKPRRSSTNGCTKLGKPLPPMALHLLRYYKENKGKEDKKSSLSTLVTKAAKTLSAEDRDRLPEELKELVQKRWEFLEQKRRWALLSEDEKQIVLKQRRQELNVKLREKAKERREKELEMKREMSRRYEDQELEGKSLPTFRLIDMPEGIPNTLFGDIAMIVEFLHCFSGLLMPNDQCPISSIALTEALAGDKGGFLYLNRVLVILLQTLLQDELAEGYSELDMPLSEIPLTMHSVSELVRLCLRPTDAHEGDSAPGSNEWQGDVGFDDMVSGEFLEKLETSEVFELNPQEKVTLLLALCHRILMTYSVEDYVEDMQQHSVDRYKERVATLKEANDRKRAEKQKRKETEGGDVAKVEKKKEPSVKEAPKAPPKEEPEPEDMISTVKSRRFMSMQAKKEKEEQERLNKVRMEKNAEEERIRRQKAAAEKAFQDAVCKAKLVMRRTPLGTDRNHNRYWLFSDVVPGLFVEKGWVSESIDYCFTLPPEEEAEEEEEEAAKKEEEIEDGDKEDDCSVVSISNENSQLGAPLQESCETTVPKQGQNLWFVCDSPKDFDELIESLHPQGVREGELKALLQLNYREVLHSIHLTKKGNPGLKTCDGYQELLKFLRSDIIEVASRLQKGGLGYMEDTSVFEDRVEKLEKLQDFGECVITLQESVIKKFLQGFMAPKQKAKKKTGGEESAVAEEVDDQKRLAEEARVATAVEKWKTAVREAHTFSRMHVLLGMLDACIKWDMSAENARCKVCRRKGEDDKLILCDECNKAFHLLCLRPALYRIPAGEWLCPACQPTIARRGSRGRNYNEGSEGEEDSEEEEEEDSEEDESEEEHRETGHSLRPRKKVKPTKPKGQSKAPQKKSERKPASKSSSKPESKTSPRPSSKSRQRASSPVDIDDLVRQSTKPPLKKHALELQKCEEILQKIMKFRYSWPFREPVSAEEAEDYQDIITTPMDLGTMQEKFKSSNYHSVTDFLEDMKLIFSNAEEYNQPTSSVLNCMTRTEEAFIELLQKSLPGVSYLRRRMRKRAVTPSEDDDEEEEDEEDETPKKIQNGKQRKAPSKRKEEEDSRRKKTRQRKQADSESDEEEEEPVRKTRTSRRDYKEESDNERDTRRAGLRRTSRGVKEEKDASSDEDSGRQRHSKRLKRS
ncbi:hypothetical protein DNTS_023763 [Danionella cerebrum]|uniref:Tyrosine-protein kinase BAZ1B n=1 Tax=Danionella cerebrum TaxID=2873325 RepID=A0A553QVR0_9TELE|nr:hypothetical protein DNTS_023763 [Danionella translucida]